MSTGPIYDTPRRTRALPTLKRGLLALLVIGFLIIGLSFVPPVSARVRPLKSVATTITKAFHRVGTLLSGPRTNAPAKKASPAQPSAKAKAPTQQAAATKPVATLSVAVKSTPAGATVQLNGRTVGKTPMTLKVAPGTYTVAISQPGYVTMTRIVTVKPGKAASVTVALVAAKPAAKQPAPATIQTPPPPSYERP